MTADIDRDKLRELCEKATPVSRVHAVETAGYWFKAARKAQAAGKLGEALLYMENAYNHAEGALVAERDAQAAENLELKAAYEHVKGAMLKFEGTIQSLKERLSEHEHQIPVAWYRAFHSPSNPNSSAECDVVCCYGEDAPDSDPAWMPLYENAEDSAHIAARQEEAETIGRAIRALKSSLPVETVSETMVEQARLIIANEIKCNGFVKSSGLCVRGTLEKHCDCREASRQILALAPADDGWRAEDMPAPDRVIHYNDGMSAPAMFHYSTENCDARTIAHEAGFEIAFVTMESEFGDDHPLMKAYVDDGEMSSVLNLWNPVVPDGWKLGGKTDSEDGPVALLLRPLPAPPKDENK